MRFGPDVFFYHEGDNVLRDQMGMIVPKEKFMNMLNKVHETYKDISEEEVKEYNQKFMEEYKDQMQKDELENKEPKPKEKTKGYVYFVRADGNFIKIGSTINLESRYKSLKVASPNDLEMLAYIETESCRELEEKVHKLLKDRGSHVNGEWFDIKKTDMHSLIRLFKNNRVKLTQYEE